MTVYFDLDGTLFNLYGKKDWLSRLHSEDETVFQSENDKDFFFENNANFFRIIKELMNKGVVFEVITWLPMGASKEYELKCTKIKKLWVTQKLPFIKKTTCLSYGIPKQTVTNADKTDKILIDDSKEVCEKWNTEKSHKSYNVNKDFTALKALREILAAM